MHNTKLLITWLFFILLNLNPNAQTLLKKNDNNILKKILDKTNFNTDLSLYSFNADSSQVFALRGGMRIGIAFEGQSNEQFSYYGKMNIFFEEGSFRALNDDSFANANTYGVEEAYFMYKPFQYFYVKAGVARVFEEHQRLFLDPPGLGSKINFKPIDYDFFEFDLHAIINTITTNATQSRTGKLNGSAAYYTILGANAKFILDSLDWKIAYRNFSFHDLNSEFAFKSRFRGSSVTGTGELASLFTNDYKGHHISTYVDFKKYYLRPIIKMEYLNNTESGDSGYLFGLTLRTDHFEYKFETLRNEPDTLPAALINPYYGGTNREGQVVGVKYLNKDYTIDVDYYAHKTTEASPFQDDLNIVFVILTRKL